MKIRALKAFTIRDSETGNLTSIAYGGIAEVSDTVGSSLISDGLAEAYTLVNPTGSVNITNNGTVDVAEYATAVVNVPGVTPTGTIEITSNGTVDVTNYATAEVNVDYTTVNFNLSESIKKTTTALSQARSYLAATTLSPTGGSDPQSGYALFGGGYAGNVYYAVVDAYDSRLTKTTTPDPLSQARSELAATTLAPTGGSDPQSGHALFAGGHAGNVYYAVVDAYDSRLTKTTTPDPLSQGKYDLAATTLAPAGGSDPQSEYALFAGGYGSVTTRSAVVDAYDSRLTKTTAATPLSEGRTGLAATTVAPTWDSDPQSGYALFAGGFGDGSSSAVVDAYHSNLIKTTTTTPLSQARSYLAATTLSPTGGSEPQSGYALFAGGYGDGYSDVVDAYDSRLTKTTTPDPLSQARSELAATTLAPTGGSDPQSGHALFAGGHAGNVYYAVVDAYDSRLTKTTTPDPLSQGKYDLAATTLAPAGGSDPQSEYALFAGGYGSVTTRSAVVDAYDSRLTKTTLTTLSQVRYHLVATTLATTGGSGYALFGGGVGNDYVYSAAVDVYGPQNYKVQVFPETKYSFNGSEELVSDTWQEINISGSLIGYIKIKSTNVVG